MLDAFKAVKAALNPIAALSLPANLIPGAATFDGSASTAACNLSIASYAWTRSGGVSIVSGADNANVSITWTGATGSLTLTVKDSAGGSDVAVVKFSGSGVTSAAPPSGGSVATACPAALNVMPVAPTVTEAFSPAAVAVNTNATLTYTLVNANAFALTQAAFNQMLPAALSIATTPAAITSCNAGTAALSAGGSAVSFSGFTIPAQGSCTISMSITSATAGSYTATVAANALNTGPAGGNAVAASATLAVGTSASGSGASGSGTSGSGTSSAGAGSGGHGGGGGGDVDWLDIVPIALVLIIGRHRAYAASQRKRL
jgi:uncharacterized membrane protein YgcG